MLKEYDVVRLMRDLDDNLRAGSVGTILIVYPSDPPEYEVEFVDDDGDSIGVRTVPGANLEEVGERK